MILFVWFSIIYEYILGDMNILNKSTKTLFALAVIIYHSYK